LVESSQGALRVFPSISSSLGLATMARTLFVYLLAEFHRANAYILLQPCVCLIAAGFLRLGQAYDKDIQACHSFSFSAYTNDPATPAAGQ